MSSLLYAELAATCNALGYYDGNKYYVDADCVETVKDLIRYLRRDDANHEIRRHLGEAKVLQTDLLPILKHHWHRTDLFDVVLRLLVNLTNPVLLLYREELPEDKTSRNYYLQLIGHLQAYKEAFADGAVWTIFSKKLSEIMQIEWQDRSEDTSLVMERILILVRNVLQVPADPEAEKRTDNDASIHDQVLWVLHESGTVDLLLYISSMESEHQYYMHVLEIVSLMMREQNPAELASAALQRSVVEKQRDETELLAIRQEEMECKLSKVRKYAGSRHSRFGGTFILKDVKSISDQDLIYHKPLNNLEALNFDLEKTKQKRPKNRLPMKGELAERRSAYSIRLFLKEFCVEFLTGAYNSLMHAVKDGLARARTQANDESYYLWAIKFFMEFNRHYNFQVQYVSETMHVQTFHYVQTQLDNCYEMMVTDKKKLQLWSKRMHLALKAYQELLMTLMAMDKSPDEGVRNSSKVIKNNVLYVIEYRELILTLLLNFDEVKMSRLYLKDLIETAHIFLKMLEQFCSRGHVMVQKPVARRKKKRKQKAVQPEAQPALEDLWNDLAAEVSAVLQGGVDPSVEVVPFDATSGRDADDQKMDAMKNAQTYLKERKFEEAIALLRACREVWPEDDVFGSHNMAPEEELLLFKDVFVAVIPGGASEVPAVTENPQPYEDDEEDETDDEEEEGMGTSLAEQDFKFMDFAKRLAHSKVMCASCLLLSQFDKNSTHTNHCVVKLLHRVAFDCKMPTMLFQASLFRTFQRILDSRNPQHKELMKFATYVLQKFAQVAEKNKKVFMELLFWKSSRDTYEIENGYGSYSAQSHSSKLSWTEEEEFELQRLYEEYTSKQEGPSSGVVDWIMENLINKERSKRGVLKKLKEMGIVVNTKAAPKRLPKQWQSSEEEQLAQLFGQFQESADRVGEVMSRLTVTRPRSQVVAKLLELGLVQDKKELRKKRSRTSRNHLEGDSKNDSGHSESSDADSGSESPRDSWPGRAPAVRKAPAPRQPARQWKAAADVQQKRVAPAVVFSREKATAALQNVITAGMQEALEWLRETLVEEATDREAEQPLEGVAILPLSEPCVVAMDDPTFLRMVAALGLEKPLITEGVYWRMPASLSARDLRVRADLISIALGLLVEGTGDDEPPTMADTGRSRQSSESSGDEFEHLKQLMLQAANRAQTQDQGSSGAKRKSKQRGEMETSSHVVDMHSHDASDSEIGRVSFSGRKNTVLESTDTDSEGVATMNEKPNEKNAKSHRRKKIVVHSSDLEEDEAVGSPKDLDEDTIHKTRGKRLLDSDSDDEGLIRTAIKRQSIIDDEND